MPLSHKESTLYLELRDLMMDDTTIYQHLANQRDIDDLTVAVALIRQLVKEKKAYFDDAVNTRNMSNVPMIVDRWKEVIR